MEYPNSLKVLKDDLARAPQTTLTVLVKAMIDGAVKVDLKKVEGLGVHPKLGDVKRDLENPPLVNSPSILGASWADDENNPLKPGEKWNEGRRASNTGVQYAFNEHGHPVNPFFNAGINGRGVLGSFGPNHAVDNGVLIVKEEEGKPVLYAQGIYRKDVGAKTPALAGGFAKYTKTDDGAYVFDRAAVVVTQMEELFEEMISGSIPLLPEYQAMVEPMFAAELNARHTAGAIMNDAHREEVKEQIKTALKMKQVQDIDPGFLHRLYAHIANGHECFAGPVLGGNRTTNNAWIESRMSWFLFDDKTWEQIRGPNPAFDYRFAAGDDAEDIALLRLDGDLIRNAFDSHGPMFVFMTASYLLHQQEQGVEIPDSILDQARGIALSLG